MLHIRNIFYIFIFIFILALRCTVYRLRLMFSPKTVLTRHDTIRWAIFQIYGTENPGILTRLMTINQLEKFLKDSGLLTRSASSIKEISVSGKTIKLKTLSVSQLELEVRKLKKRVSDKCTQKTDMSLDISFLQFCELLPQITSLMIDCGVDSNARILDCILLKTIKVQNSRKEKLACESFSNVEVHSKIFPC
jgi:hypothetical protein